MANPGLVNNDSNDGWEEIGLISLDKCVGNNSDPLRPHADFNTWVQNLLNLTGSEQDKAYLVDKTSNQILQYNVSANQWQSINARFNSTNDPIFDVDNQTHYADFDEIEEWAQLRFTAKSVMNTHALTGQHVVAMPEMQFFGLPDKTINTGTPATVSYLKAEDATGNLYDILGTQRTLPSISGTAARLYVGGVQDAASTLYLTFQETTGLMRTSAYEQPITASAINFTSITSSYISSPTYYELYINNTSGDKIILSSGYTGVPTP